ncbi:MAG: Fic family protein [Saprospiraceae bacterium]|nr:Fic family protein [Saprospiraceae bacterium]MBK7525111.1 Fic family protein [Saprospiraceae bacterium]MBK8079827.1 Fic family protein [Saprospiraceae bacterium]MBK8372463.1 Fic family protein [Saprospiraceae bacterium]MBK8855059.1 Fic family protein [Saprospiraceae bacterium]
MKFDPRILINNELDIVLKRISSKKRILDSKRPFPVSVVDRLRQDFITEWTYHSNNIEGNTLTASETKMILEDGITVGGKTLREHFEVVNHQKAIVFLEELVNNNIPMRCMDILTIHRLVMTNVLDDFAGRLRPGMVRIIGANFTPPNASKVSALLDDLADFVVKNEKELDPAVLATLFHHRFVWIHPFNDGNGRTVRLAMNLILMRAGYPPAFILAQDRKKYINALNNANTGDYQKLFLMMFQAIERSLNLYINALGGDYEDYEPISHLVSEENFPYGQEYLSLLARRGRIDAYKEGKTWLTTKSAVAQYQKAKLK